MRPVAISVLLLSALAGLAVAPMAAAAPAQPPCNGVWGTTQTVGPVTVFASPPCYEVTVDPMSCPVSPKQERTVAVERVKVTVLYCGSPEAATTPSPSSAAVPPVCIHRGVEAGPASAGADLCRQSHETFPCFSPQRIHHYEQVGPAYAQVHFCFPHSPPATLGAAALEADLPDACGETAYCTAPECPAETVASDVDHHNSVTLNPDCTVDVVTGRGQVCVGAWTRHDTIQVGPVTWDRHSCGFPGGSPVELTTAAAPAGPCGAASPGARCPAPVGPCTGLAHQGSDPAGPVGVRHDVSSNCRVALYLKADVMDCLWAEGWNPGPSAGPVSVYTWGCRSPTVASAADPFPTCVTGPCGPSLPNPGCLAQDLTPAPLQHALWGYDPDGCTLDAHTACPGGASRSTDARVAFVDVSLAHCDGPSPA